MPRDSNPKQRILDTASRLFFYQGYNATGINQILEEAGVAKASLYTHFGSKDELGIAYLREARKDWFRGLEQLLHTREKPVDKLLGCFDYVEQNLKANAFQGCRFINLMAEIDSMNKEMQQQIVEHKSALRKLIRQLAAAAGSRSSTEELPPVADAIYLLLEGAIVEAKIYKDNWPVKAAKKMTKALLR